MKCPYCAKKNCDPSYVTRHVENYGDGIFVFKCKFCHQVIEAGLSRIVKVDFIKKTTKESDWA